MTSREKESRLANELERVLNYFRDEYEMTYAEVTGVLGILKTSLEMECIRVGEEASEDDDSE